MNFLLNSLLKTEIKIKVVDVGANPIDGDPIYKPLLAQGSASVVGFEPEPAAFARLNAVKGPNEAYLSYALGDGKTHTLHFCSLSGMTSLYQPNMAVLGLLHGFPEWARVVRTEEVATRRLDDISEATDCQLLKLDVQGAELMILQNSVEMLKTTLVVHTEVEFVPMYTGQPLFSDVDVFLRSQGFVLHRFVDQCSRVLRPLTINNDIYAGLSQLFWSDAVYIRDFTRLDLLAPQQLLQMALLMHECYRSYDMVLYFLTEHDRRAGTRYGEVYQHDGLMAKPAS